MAPSGAGGGLLRVRGAARAGCGFGVDRLLRGGGRAGAVAAWRRLRGRAAARPDRRCFCPAGRTRRLRRIASRMPRRSRVPSIMTTKSGFSAFEDVARRLRPVEARRAVDADQAGIRRAACARCRSPASRRRPPPAHRRAIRPSTSPNTTIGSWRSGVLRRAAPARASIDRRLACRCRSGASCRRRTGLVPLRPVHCCCCAAADCGAGGSRNGKRSSRTAPRPGNSSADADASDRHLGERRAARTSSAPDSRLDFPPCRRLQAAGPPAAALSAISAAKMST